MDDKGGRDEQSKVKTNKQKNHSAKHFIDTM